MALAGQGMLINWANIRPEHRRTYYTWHNNEHMVGRVQIPGFHRGRRYIAVDADRGVLNFYEVDDISVLTSPQYRAKADNPSELTLKTSVLLTDAVRALTRIRASFGVGEGGMMLTMRFDAEPGREGELEKWLAGEGLPALLEDIEITGAHLAVADQDKSNVVTPERKLRPKAAVPSWIVMIEGCSLEAVKAAGGKLSDTALAAHGGKGPVVRGTYRLEITVTRPLA